MLTLKKNITAEKKRNSRKSLIIKNGKNKILYVSKLYCGKTHDYTILKAEFSPKSNCFKHIEIDVDSGFQGIKTDYKAQKINIPYKKKRKKKGECNKLSEQQKAYNKAMASERVDVEHSIGQMKNCRIIHQTVRIRNRKLLDEIVLLTAGIANFKNEVSY